MNATRRLNSSGGTVSHLHCCCSLTPLPDLPLTVWENMLAFREQHVIQLLIVLVSLVREASKITELVTV